MRMQFKNLHAEMARNNVSVDDIAKDLIDNGFVFTRYLATEYVEYENETTFIKDTSLAREVIDIEELFKNK